MKIRQFSAFILLAIAIDPAMAASSPPIVAIDTGEVSGVVEDKRIIFRGIPYAAPPTGPLRWRAPQPVKPWRNVRDASKFGPICRQPATPTPGTKAESQSEDCLFLNITRPAGDARGLPVLFWIPGGGLVAGSGSQESYDGRRLADKGTIVVTINYRVGRLGFFAHPALSRENADGGRLYNYGLMDQIAALAWVKRNIASFGGDPAKVTIFGESAGGASVDALMIAPAARGLFSAAISESGYGRGSFPRLAEVSADGDAPAESIGTGIAAKLGMAGATLDSLRTVPADRIIALFDRNEEHIFAVDGGTLTSDIWPAFARDQEAPVPFILGSNSFEMGMMGAEDQRPWAEKVVPADKWDRLTPYYGGSRDLRDRLLLSDIIYTTQVRAIASSHAANGHPTYVYRFDVPSGPPEARLPGAAHGAEIAYVFGNFGKRLPENTDVRVSEAMMRYWSHFAKSGTPNGEGLAPWPVYKDHVLLQIAPDGDSAIQDPLLARIDAIDAAAQDIQPQ